MKITDIKVLAELIKKKFEETQHEILVKRNLSAKCDVELDYDNSGFVLNLEAGSTKETKQYFTIVFSADVWDRDIGRGTSIVEFKDVKLEGVESDSIAWGVENLDITDAEPLLEIGNTVVNDANFYRLVDSEVYTTDDSNITYSELSEDYDRNYR